jgi:hypothetical protein
VSAAERPGWGPLPPGNLPGFSSVVVDGFVHPDGSEKALYPPVATPPAHLTLFDTCRATFSLTQWPRGVG